jgi:hypothetical protein
MLTLGEELVLVALDADKGVLRGSAPLQIGLNAAGMADLAARGWLTLRQAGGPPRVTVVYYGDPGVSEQPLLADLLLQARDWKGDLHPERCLRNWVSPSLYSHLKSLRERGILEWDKPKNSQAFYGRFHLLDTEAADSALAGVERVATGAGPSERDLDLAGIVHGLGLDKVLYKGRRNRSKREGLAAAVARHRFAMMLARALPQVAGQKFTFDTSNDTNMAMYMDGGMP